MGVEKLELLQREMAYQLGIEAHRIPIVVLATVGIYLAFMLLVKLFGSRVLTSMTASDAVIIIMFGAVSGRVIVGNPPTLASGVVGLATLMCLEAAFGIIRHYIGWSRVIDRKPVLLLYQGNPLEANMRFAHVSKGDLRSAVRKAGIGDLADIHVMILEPTGTISIIRRGVSIDPELFIDVLGAEELASKDRELES